MIWSFFGSGHDKGEHYNNAREFVKRDLTHEKLKGSEAQLKCAIDIVQFLPHHLLNAFIAHYPSKHRNLEHTI